MTVAAITKTTARVLWLIGARNTSATFDATVGNDNFIQEEVRRALIETEAELAADLADSRHPMRNAFLTWSSDLTNESLIPAHLGEIEAVQIKPTSGGTFALAEKESRENIRLWRENYQSVFDAINHNAVGSTLSGFYNITGQTLTFTGHVAQVKLFNFVPDYATPAHQLDNVFEGHIVAGTIPRLLKIGVPTALVQHYGQMYQNLRSNVRQGHLQQADIGDLQEVE